MIRRLTSILDMVFAATIGVAMVFDAPPPALAGQRGVEILYVDDDAPAGGTGASWKSAFRFLQDALATASKPASGITEIRVGQGTYLPNKNAANPDGSTDRNSTFRLISEVAIRGGYFGLSAGKGQDPNLRNIEDFASILSGDFLGNDPAPPLVGTLATVDHFLNGEENAYQVVTALNVDETAVLDGFTVTGGRADGPGFGAVPESREQGAGLNVYFSSPTIINCTFLRNWNNNHGAVNDHGDFTTLTNCTFRANYAVAFGAGMYSHHHSASTLDNCRMFDNFTPGEGAGGYSRSMRFAAYTNCEFRGNRSNNKGGGMYNAAESTTTFANCLFDENSSSHGGGMYCDGSNAMLTAATFSGNFADSQGGGMFNSLGAPVISNCTFTMNEAPGGGGGCWNSFGAASVTGCTFTANISEGGGAGLYNEGGNPSVANCQFISNHSNGGGGGMWNGLNSMTITNCAFADNTAVSGGGMYNADSGAPNVTNCTFTANHAEEGGGMYNFLCDTVVNGCQFTQNTATSSAFETGGALLNYFCNPTISDCTFTENYAEFGGGAAYNEGDTATYTRCTFIRNLAVGQDEGWGGAVLNGYFSESVMYNCLFAGNVARKGGGVFNITFSSPALVNCTLVGNRSLDDQASGSGGGVYNFDSSSAQLANCIVWSNAPDAIGGVPADVRHSAVEGGYGEPGAGNISTNPNFVAAPYPGNDGIWGTPDDNYGDVRLAAGSPCIDAGDNTAMPANVTIDLAGEPRFVNDPQTPDSGVPDNLRPIVDLGAHEFQPQPCIGDVAPPGGDGVVNVNDLLAVINAWGACQPQPAECPADVTGDGVVNVNDLLAVINAWGVCQ